MKTLDLTHVKTSQTKEGPVWIQGGEKKVTTKKILNKYIRIKFGHAFHSRDGPALQI